jgi:hypothetical protein
LFWIQVARLSLLIAPMRDVDVALFAFSMLRFVIYRSPFDR